MTKWAFLRAVLLFGLNSMVFNPEMGSVILNIFMEFNFSLASCGLPEELLLPMEHQRLHGADISDLQEEKPNHFISAGYT